MINELYWIAMLLINFISILFIYKFYGKIGLFCWIPISTIIANIQVVMLVDLFGISATLGNIVYATSFLVTDILSENYGEREAKKAVGIGFFSLIILTVIMQIALRFVPSSSPDAQAMYNSVSMIFGFLPRLVLASLLAYFTSQRFDVFAYSFWRKRFPDTKHIWIRNNGSTLISQLFDSSIFVLVAFYGVFDSNTLWEIFITTYLLKFIVGVLDTPFVYLASSLKKRGYIKEIVD